MKKKSKDKNNKTSAPSASKKLTAEEVCKKYGIPYLNETEKYVGQSFSFA